MCVNSLDLPRNFFFFVFLLLLFLLRDTCYSCLLSFKIFCCPLSLQLSVTVSFSVSIVNAKLSIVDKDQGVASKSVR